MNAQSGVATPAGGKFISFTMLVVAVQVNLSSRHVLNIGTQSVQELFFCDSSIRRTVYSNDLVKCF